MYTICNDDHMVLAADQLYIHINIQRQFPKHYKYHRSRKIDCLGMKRNDFCTVQCEQQDAEVQHQIEYHRINASAQIPSLSTVVKSIRPLIARYFLLLGSSRLVGGMADI